MTIYLAPYLPMELHTPCKLLLLETTALDVACLAKAADNVCYLFTNQAINLLSTDLPSKLSIYRSIYLFFYPSVYLSPLFCDLCRRSSRSVARSRSMCYLSISLSLSTYLLRYPPISLSVYLSPEASAGLTTSTHFAGFFAAGYG